MKLKNLSFHYRKSESWVKLALVIILLFVVAYNSARIVLNLTSMVNPARLIPISFEDIFSASSLAIILYITGFVISLQFPISQAALWYSLMFVLRLFTAVLLTIFFQYDDELFYHYAGMEQVYGIFSFGAGRLYYNLVNVLYLIFGENILLPKMMNVFLGSLLPFFVFNISYHLFGDQKVSWRAFLFAGFLPPLIIYSAVNLKEISTGFLIVLLQWILIKPNMKLLQRLISLSLCILMIYWLRGAPWTFIGLIGVGLYFVLTAKTHFYVKKILIMLIGLLSYLLFDEIKLIILSRTTQEMYFMERFSDPEALVSRYLILENPFSGKNLSVLFFRGFFSPSPLRFYTDYGIDARVTGINMLAWYILFPLVIIVIFNYRKNGAVIALALMFLAILIIATVGVAAGSDPYRHRMVSMGLISILSAAGFKRDMIKRFRLVLLFWILMAVFFNVMWLTFKVGE
jgi:hypothetical protein